MVENPVKIPDNRVTKNYFEDGGDTLVIGGRLVVKEGAKVEGLETGGAEVPIASKQVAGIVRVGLGLEISGTGTMNVAPATSSIAGGVKKAAARANSTATDVAGLVTDFNDLLAKLRTAGVLSNS